MNQHASLETLEDRLMLSTTSPKVMSIVADNRGQVVVRFDRPVNEATLTSRSVAMLVGKKKIAANLGWDAKTNRLYIVAKKAYPTKPYSIRLFANQIQGRDGALLDGEFRGTKLKSGDGRAGGDYIVNLVPKAIPVARFSTIYGEMDVRLYDKAAPTTYANFLHYANRGEWDGTFMHRSVQGGAGGIHVVQGGGYRIRNNQFQNIPQVAPIANEAKPTLSNLRGTISMARTNEPNSATKEWFFNNKGNPGLDASTGNPGYAVFGKVANTPSLKILDKLASLGIYDASAVLGLNELPVNDLNAVKARTPASLLVTDLAIINRVAMLMDVKAPAKAAAKATARSVAAEQPAVTATPKAAPAAQAVRPTVSAFNTARPIALDSADPAGLLA